MCCGAAQQVDYEVETLLVASKHGRIIGGATLARCPRGVVVKEVGALQGLGGGTALLAGAASFARRTDDSDAAQFWGRGGFYRLHWGWFAYNRCPERHSELAARLHHEAAGRLTEAGGFCLQAVFCFHVGFWFYLDVVSAAWFIFCWSYSLTCSQQQGKPTGHSVILFINLCRYVVRATHLLLDSTVLGSLTHK